MPTLFSTRPKLFLTIAQSLMVWAFGFNTFCDAAGWTFQGHAKYQYSYIRYEPDALFYQLGDQQSQDHYMDTRIATTRRWSNWDVKIHYQLIGLYSDTLNTRRKLSQSSTNASQSFPSDDSRALDFTHEFTDSGKKALLHRLDRASVGFTSPSLVLRLGREAISWGNGLAYNPMDVFNPFEPSAVDKDYKNGDDLVYGQWLFDSGNDIQSVVVPRRNPSSDTLESSHSSIAAKYHRFIGDKEYDLLAARHYADNLFALGLAMDWRETVIRTDLSAVQTNRKTTSSAVANISYSWLWFNKNISGFLEYFYNGFGQAGKDYSPAALANNQELLQRINRGELFTLGRNYLAGSMTIETTPLTLLTSSVFINLEDPSALLQLVFNYDWKQNLRLLCGLHFPIGANNTEFGGVPTTTSGVYQKTGNGLFVQIAYFY